MRTFEEYMKASKKLMNMLFEKDVVDKLNKSKLKKIDWNDVDITDCGITATFPSIKERFNTEWIEYFKERDITAIDLFLQSVFHYGYQQGVDYEKENRPDYSELFEMLKNAHK